MSRAARQLPYQVVHYIAATYSGASDSTGKVVGTIPANSLIVSWHVRIAVACGGTATINLGWANGTTATNTNVIAATASITENTVGGYASAIAVSTQTADDNTDRDVLITTANIASTGRFEVVIGYVPATDILPVV